MITKHVIHVVLLKDDAGNSDSIAPKTLDDRYLAVWLPVLLSKMNEKHFFTQATEMYW